MCIRDSTYDGEEYVPTALREDKPIPTVDELSPSEADDSEGEAA